MMRGIVTPTDDSIRANGEDVDIIVDETSNEGVEEERKKLLRTLIVASDTLAKADAYVEGFGAKYKVSDAIGEVKDEIIKLKHELVAGIFGIRTLYVFPRSSESTEAKSKTEKDYYVLLSSLIIQKPWRR